MVTPEVAFTGDTSAEVFSSPGFEDALAAKLLIMEATFLEDDVSQQHAKVSGSGPMMCEMACAVFAMPQTSVLVCTCYMMRVSLA